MSFFPLIPGGKILTQTLTKLINKFLEETIGCFFLIFLIFLIFNAIILFVLLSIEAISVLLSLEIDLPWLLYIYKDFIGIIWEWTISVFFSVIYLFILPSALFMAIRKKYDIFCYNIAQSNIVFLILNFIKYNVKKIRKTSIEFGWLFVQRLIVFVIPVLMIWNFISPFDLPIIVYPFALLLRFMIFLACGWALGCITGLIISITLELELDSQTKYDIGFLKSLIFPNFLAIILGFLFLILYRKEYMIIQPIFAVNIILILWLIFGGLAYIKHIILRFSLWHNGYIPWNITRFLDYCTERLILQRVGNRYRFIHRLVQEHFAKLEIQKE